MHPPGIDGRSAFESMGVFSPDGEYLPFVSQIITEGRPEEWLNSAEAAMFQATKKNLYRVLEDSKGNHPIEKLTICLVVLLCAWGAWMI